MVIGSLRGGLRRGGQGWASPGWPQRGARRLSSRGRIPTGNSSVSDSGTSQPSQRALARARVCPARRPTSAPTPCSPAPLPRHHISLARPCLPSSLPSAPKCLGDKGAVSIHGASTYQVFCLPLLRSRCTLFTPEPGPAYTPQAGSPRLGPPGDGCSQSPARLRISPLCVSPMSTLPAAHALGGHRVTALL